MHVTYDTPPHPPGALVARLEGRFDGGGATVFWESVSQLVDPDHRYVVLDLSGVTILTSAGLGVLVRLHTRLHPLGGGLAIVGASSKIRELVDIVMLGDVLRLCDGEAGAWRVLGV